VAVAESPDEIFALNILGLAPQPDSNPHPRLRISAFDLRVKGIHRWWTHWMPDNDRGVLCTPIEALGDEENSPPRPSDIGS
jgi:hypothetical protein